MIEKKTTRRERLAAERKQRILEAATKVFAEKGFHRATTKEIAEAADIAEGTIYNYFASKDDILLEMITQLADLQTRGQLYEEALDQDIRRFWTEHLIQRLVATRFGLELYRATLPEIMNSPELRERYNREVIQPASDILEQHLRVRVERGEIPAPPNLPFAVRAVVATALGLQFMLVLDDPIVREAWEDPHELAKLLIPILFDGLNIKD